MPGGWRTARRRKRRPAPAVLPGEAGLKLGSRVLFWVLGSESWVAHWRRGRDSNPRNPFGLTGFRDRPDQPLQHLSARSGGRILAFRIRLSASSPKISDKASRGFEPGQAEEEPKPGRRQRRYARRLSLPLRHCSNPSLSAIWRIPPTPPSVKSDSGSLVADSSPDSSHRCAIFPLQLPGTGSVSYARTNMDTAIELSHVSKSFGKFRAVDDLSFRVPKGTVFGLLGPNGAGKTTTIRMTMNITAPDSGEIRVLGRTMDRETQGQIGYLPEERGLYRRMKVSDQLYFLAAIKGVSRELARQRIDEWLDKMEVRPWLNKKVDELSKGMEQKIQFIATIVHDPDVLILDEVFSGLDPINAALIK